MTRLISLYSGWPWWLIVVVGVAFFLVATFVLLAFKIWRHTQQLLPEVGEKTVTSIKIEQSGAGINFVGTNKGNITQAPPPTMEIVKDGEWEVLPDFTFQCVVEIRLKNASDCTKAIIELYPEKNELTKMGIDGVNMMARGNGGTKGRMIWAEVLTPTNMRTLVVYADAPTPFRINVRFE